MHVNTLEIRAILLVPSAFQDQIIGLTLVFMTNISSLVACLNKPVGHGFSISMSSDTENFHLGRATCFRDFH